MAVSGACSIKEDLSNMQEMDPLSEETIGAKAYSKSINPVSTGKVRIIKTASLFANFIFLLAATAQTSAALVDLASAYSITLAKMSVFLSVSCLFYISGTWVGGLLYSRVNVFALLSGFSFCFTIAFGACVFMPNAELFISTSAVWSVCGGAIDTLANSHFLAMWDSERLRDSLMQGMHASWSAGVMSMGAMLKLFLNPDLQARPNMTAQAYLSPTPSLQNASALPSLRPSRVHYAYILFACLSLLPLCSHVALFAWDRRHQTDGAAARSEKASNGEARNDKAATDLAINSRRLTGRLAIVPVVFAVLVRIFDVELFIGTFLPSYLFFGLDWSTPDASVAFSVFFAGQFSGRLFCVLVSAFVKPFYIILVNGCLILASSIVLALFGHIGFIPYLTSFVMGIGNSSSFPSVFLWLSAFTPVTGPKSASLFLGDLTTLLSPAFGYVIESRWPSFFVYFTAVSGFLCICALLVGHWVSLRLLSARKAAAAAAETLMAPTTDATGKIPNGAGEAAGL